MTEATREGVSESTDDSGATPVQQRRNPRADYVEDLSDRFEARRRQELNEAVENDPGAKHLQSSMEADMEAANAAATATAVADGVNLEEGVVEAQPITQEKKTVELPDFVVKKEDGYYMHVKVDGVEKLVPMDRARAQLQKEEAVEVRYDYVNRKIAELNEREKALQNSSQPATVATDTSATREGVDDDGLEKQAKKLVNSLFTQNEDEAAAELANVLRNNRTPTTASVDPDKLADRAADVVLTKIEKRTIEKDAKDGFKKFAADYPDVVNDPHLFKIADGMTDTIAAEHPDWLPSQVMAEAGARTMKWWKGAREEKPVATNTNSEPESNIRQIRKDQLKPMPASASMRYQIPKEERPQTPADALREMRIARGQPV